jgi:predicted Zn-dependent protease with MMP-like domain
VPEGARLVKNGRVARTRALSCREACGNVRSRRDFVSRSPDLTVTTRSVPATPELTPMDRTRFTRLVTDIVNELPDEFASRLANVEVVVEERPSRAQLLSVGLDPRVDTLFGLYEGIPLEERSTDIPALPDKISLFYRPLVEACGDEADLRGEIRTTILHEVAHFFGIDDGDLESWGY